jgi:dTDP-4-amino-4,6-dideoxygalactose transaminase
VGIPFVDLKTQYLAMQADIDAAVARVLQHGNFIMGPEVAELEKTLGGYVGVPHAVGCSSGTDALQLILRALEIGPGDAVFTTPFTFVATAEVIRLCGATPVFVDIDPATWNLDPAALAQAVKATEAAGVLRPRAVIAVDLYGLPADYPALEAFCASKGLALLEDAAQSFGASLGTRRACAFGTAAATSFFPAKPLGCYGDGGMVFTRDKDLADRMVSLRVHGKGTDKYDNVRVGMNARLDTLQAAVVLAKWPRFADEVAARQRCARRYDERLEPILGKAALPVVPEGYASAWAQYTLRLPAAARDAISRKLSSAGIPSMVYYPKPLHLQGAFADLGHKAGDFPVSEACAATVLSLPFGPYLSEKDQDAVCSALASL